MQRSLLLILIFPFLPLGLLEAQQTPAAPRPANPAPPARRNSAYDDAVAKARELARQKDFKAAATASEQAIQMDDKRWEGYVVAAESYSGQRLYDDAIIGMLEAALVRAPTDKKPAVRDAISETRKLLLPRAAPQVSAGTPNPNAINNDNGPSLEVTMKFIQDKLNEQGPVKFNYISRGGYGDEEHEGPGNHSSNLESSYEVSKVTADANTCLVSYHRKDSADDYVTESDTRLNLRDVKKIVVVRDQQIQQQIVAEAHAANNWKPPQITIVPQVMDLFLEKAEHWHNALGRIPFLDNDLASRVAKAFTHAIELCTPGRESEPF
jgi:hypothetical protein